MNANCYEDSTGRLLRGTEPHAIHRVHGIQVGLFGIMYNMGKQSFGLHWTNPIEAALDQVRQLREKGAQVIVALTHQNWEDDN